MPKMRKAAKGLYRSFRLICPGSIEIVYATSIFVSFFWSFAFIWTAFFGGQVLLSPVEFTDANPWRGLAYLALGLPFFLALGILISLGIATVFAYSALLIPDKYWRAKADISARIEPVWPGNFKKF